MVELRGLRREGNAIVFSWADGLEAAVSPREMRLVCPCAFCVSEVTGQRLLDPDTVSHEIGLKDMQPTGNYAYRMLFTDGHDSGIYRLELLRELTQAAADRGQA